LRRLHGLIERLPRTHRYGLTPDGLHAALCCTRAYARRFRPGLAQVLSTTTSPSTSKLGAAFDQAFDHWGRSHKLVA